MAFIDDEHYFQIIHFIFIAGIDDGYCKYNLTYQYFHLHYAKLVRYFEFPTAIDP